MSATLSEKELLAVIQFSFIKKLGPIGMRKLWAQINNIEDLLEGRFNFNAISGFSPAFLKEVFNPSNIGRAKDLGKEQYEYCLKNDIHMLHWKHPHYPKSLRFCSDAPFLLYYQGALSVLNRKVLSIVGTRNESSYGQRVLEELGSYLKPYKDQILVLSGLAFGIDVRAHKNALQNDIPTLAAVAHGHHIIYPSVHSGVAKEMIYKGGGILSEFSIHHKPDRENFPKRNRIIAGMADTLLVVESGLKGGSMISAQLANDYQKEVLAVPGKIFDKYSLGCNQLIQTNKAHCLHELEDVVRFLNLKQSNQEVQTELPLFTTLTSEEERLCHLIKNQPNIDVDQLAIAMEWTVVKLNQTLFHMELKGLLSPLPGRKFRLHYN